MMMKFQQKLARMSEITYWLSNYAYDMLICTIAFGIYYAELCVFGAMKGSHA